MMNDTASGAAYLRDDGSPYQGEAFDSGKGFLFGEGNVSCPACNGGGRGRRGPCGRCRGAKTVFDQFKIYTPENFARLQRDRNKRRQSKQNEEIRRQEVVQQAHLDYVETHAELFGKARAEKDNAFLQDLVAKSEVYGGLTDMQTRAMRAVVESLETARIRHAGSQAIGVVGDDVETTVECISCRTMRKPNFMKTDMEDVFAVECTDDAGNAIVIISRSFSMEPGERLAISGQVREVENSRGFVRTRLASVRPLELLPTAGMP